MATMFGLDATTLSEPRGAGSAPLAPVQERVVDPVIPRTPVVDANAGFTALAGNLLTQGGSWLSQKVKAQEAQPEWMSVRNEFQTKLARLSEAANQATDGVTKNKYLTQARTLYNQYMANYSHYGEDFSKALSQAYGYNKEGSGFQEVEDIRKRDVEAKQKAIQELSAVGMVPQIGEMSAEQADAAYKMYQEWNSLKVQHEKIVAEQDRQIKLNAEGRAQQSHAFQVSQQTLQLEAQQRFAGTMNAAVDFMVTNTSRIKNGIDSGEFTYTEGIGALETAIASQRSQALIALQGDPTLMSQYSSFYDNYLKVTKEYLNPETRTKALEDEYRKLITVEKIAIARRSGGAQAIALVDAVGSDVLANVNMARFVNGFINDLEAVTHSNTVPSVLAGDSGTQKATFSSLQEQMTRLKNGELPAGNQAVDQVAKVTNAVLNSVGSLTADNPKSLAAVNDYLASDAVAELVKQGRLSPAMAAKAREPFLENYAKGLGKSMDNFLFTTVGEATYSGGQRDVAQTPTNVQFLRFEPKPDGTFSVTESRDPNYKFVLSPYRASALRSQAEKQAAEVSRTVRSYAHLQGHTNYERAWDEIRHIIVPNQYPTPNRVKEAMADGWDGVGFFNNGSSWRQGNSDGRARTGEE